MRQELMSKDMISDHEGVRRLTYRSCTRHTDQGLEIRPLLVSWSDVQLPRRLGERDRPSREKHAPPSLAQEGDRDGERHKADDSLDPEHPLVSQQLTDPPKDGRAECLTTEHAGKGRGQRIAMSVCWARICLGQAQT
jgi:hypothetical protein